MRTAQLSTNSEDGPHQKPNLAGTLILHFPASRIMNNVSKNEVKVLVAQSCLALHDPMICSTLGSSVQGFLQARILEWVATPFSRGSS